MLPIVNANLAWFYYLSRQYEKAIEQARLTVEIEPNHFSAHWVLGNTYGKLKKYDEAKVSERLRDHSWFIAFAPLDDPKIALAVIVENGGFGARAAAPIARTMLDYFLLGKIPKSMEAPEDDAVEQEGKESD